MPRRRSRRSSRRSHRRGSGHWVTFRRPRRHRVWFSNRRRGRSRRRSTTHLRVWQQAMKACSHRRGVKPGTKRFGQCMRAYVRSHGGSRRRSRRSSRR